MKSEIRATELLETIESALTQVGTLRAEMDAEFDVQIKQRHMLGNIEVGLDTARLSAEQLRDDLGREWQFVMRTTDGTA